MSLPTYTCSLKHWPFAVGLHRLRHYQWWCVCFWACCQCGFSVPVTPHSFLSPLVPHSFLSPLVPPAARFLFPCPSSTVTPLHSDSYMVRCGCLCFDGPLLVPSICRWSLSSSNTIQPSPPLSTRAAFIRIALMRACISSTFIFLLSHSWGIWPSTLLVKVGRLYFLHSQTNHFYPFICLGGSWMWRW